MNHCLVESARESRTSRFKVRTCFASIALFGAAALLSLAAIAQAEDPKARLTGADRELIIVGSFNDYNEVFRGTAKRDPGGWASIELVGEVNKVRCTGRSAVVHDPGNDDCQGTEGVGRLQCTDGRDITVETTWTTCSRLISTGVDQDGRLITFLSGHSKEVVDKLFAAEREQAATRPALPRYNPKATLQKRGYATGSGFVVSTDGYVVTNFRLTEGAGRVSVLTADGTRHPARVVARHEQFLLTLLKIDSASSPLTVRDKHGTKAGVKVVAVGYPLIAIARQRQKSTSGTVSATNDIIGDDRFIQMNLPIQAGNCGGPLLDSKGDVVGVMTLPIDPVRAAEGMGSYQQNVGYALKAEHLRSFLDEHIKIPDGPTGAAGSIEGNGESVVKDSEKSVVLVIAE